MAQLDYSVQECQALVLAPTRELAQQIEKVCTVFAKAAQYVLASEVVWSSYSANSDVAASRCRVARGSVLLGPCRFDACDAVRSDFQASRTVNQ